MFVKATVTSFDPVTMMSKCRGEGSGRTYIDVGFARAVNDDSGTPKPGDRVALWEDNGQFWIVFKLDRISQKEEKAFVPDVSPSGDSPISFSESTTLDHTLAISRTNVAGAVPGDRILAARGGALIGVLLGGVIIARASALCSVIMSKADNILKIFVRNFEKHTSASSTVEACRYAKTYTYTEYYINQHDSDSSVPSVVTCHGNVSEGMFYKLSFRSTDPEPPTDTRVSMVSIPGKYSKTLYSEGTSKESAEKELEMSTAEGGNLLRMNSDGIVASSSVKIKLQVGTTIVELTPTKLKFLADLISENGV